jgi:hypothetical protein
MNAPSSNGLLQTTTFLIPILTHLNRVSVLPASVPGDDWLDAILRQVYLEIVQQAVLDVLALEQVFGVAVVKLLVAAHAWLLLIAVHHA